MRIAIVRLSAMGDIVNSTFILDPIKAAYPHARIDWFCETIFAPLLADHPLIDTIHPLPLKRIKKHKSFLLLIHTIRTLRALPRYDLVMDLQGLVKSALVARCLGKVRWGFAKNSIREPMASYFYTHKAVISYAQNSLWRSAFLVNAALGTHITQQSITQKKPTLFYTPAPTIQPLLQSTKNILFVIGSSQAYKNYPKARIIETITLLNMHVILIWGSTQEYDDALAIHAACPNTTIAPKLEFNELKALVAAAHLVIGNDTGPTHLAWALNIPSITLFGATSPQKLMWETPMNSALASTTTKDPLRIDKSDRSIGEIAPQIIIDTAQRLLNVSH